MSGQHSTRHGCLVWNTVPDAEVVTVRAPLGSQLPKETELGLFPSLVK